jgi:hypothetical protein
VARLLTRITLAGPVIEGGIGPGGTRVYRARMYYRGRYVASRTFPRKRDAQEWERREVESLGLVSGLTPRRGIDQSESGARSG